jgi:ubiquinone/menaquinone biosynthesis C-methylase UbiE
MAGRRLKIYLAAVRAQADDPQSLAISSDLGKSAMTEPAAFDAWSAGASYEQYMGRWSRRIATDFVDWLEPPREADWLEIGCGTGALTAAVLAKSGPRTILATDQSGGFIAHARDTIDDPRARFEVADARNLPADDASVDVVTSGLVLNFVPDRVAALREMQRVLKPGGLVSFYVWDYPGGGMGFISAFWQAARAIDPKTEQLNEKSRFPFCTREGLAAICAEAGLPAPDVATIEIETLFSDLEAFWTPFTLGAGPAPGYCMSLPEDDRQRLKSSLAERFGAEGPISLTARAWAVKTRLAL